MHLKRVGVISCGMVLGALYGLLGLIFGGVFTLISLLMMALGVPMGEGEDAMIGMFFGIGAVVLFPILYGIAGFIGGLLTGFLYNIVAKLTGGIEVTLE